MPKIQDLSKFRNPDGFRGRSAVVVQLWWIVQATIFGMSPQFMYSWRVLLLRLFGAKVGRRVIIRPSARITYPWKVEIGDYSWVGDNCELYSLGDIKIGENVVISQGSYLCGGSHRIDDVEFTIYAKQISVEDEAWIAAEAFIHPGVTIGRGAVVAARSVVRKDLESMGIYAGPEAVRIGTRGDRSLDV